jgi:hypothetical protein
MMSAFQLHIPFVAGIHAITIPSNIIPAKTKYMNPGQKKMP